jgi:hypothetical protein
MGAMKLDRNINGDGRGKYGLIKARRLAEVLSDQDPNQPIYRKERVEGAIQLLENLGIIDWGTTAKTEFFVVRLKDQFAGAALTGYALAARKVDSEYAREVANLAQRAGSRNPHCKIPD